MTETTLEVWRDVAANYNARWDARSQLISFFIRPGDIVLDLGAGDQKLKRFLPGGCGYVPVDCVEVLGNTYVVDFNKEFRLPAPPSGGRFDVVVAAGFLEYLNDPAGFVRSLAEHCPGTYFLFTYRFIREPTGQKRMRRLNYFASPEICFQSFGPSVSNMASMVTMDTLWLFSGVLSPSAMVVAPARKPINELVLERTTMKRLIIDKIIGKYRKR